MVSEAVITRLYFDVFLSFINLQTPFFTLRASVVVYLSLLLLGDTIHTDFLFEKTCGMLSATEGTKNCWCLGNHYVSGSVLGHCMMGA